MRTNTYPPRETSHDKAIGTLEILAEIAEREGDYSEASSLYQQAARDHANKRFFDRSEYCQNKSLELSKLVFLSGGYDYE